VPNTQVEGFVVLIETLDFLVRFWELKARHASGGEPLPPGEQMELLSLMQRVTHDLRVPLPAPADPSLGAVRAELIGDGVIRAIELRRVTASAIIATTAFEYGSCDGSRVVARVADAIRGVEYVLPCVVAWIHAGRPNTLALVVEGVPRRQSFSSVPDPFRRTQLAIGRHERLIG